jgi:hypothetical protein
MGIDGSKAAKTTASSESVSASRKLFILATSKNDLFTREWRKFDKRIGKFFAELQ